MEIFFCSHCSQSIPLKDIQSGVAELRRGKYLCATCKEIVPSHKEKRPNFAAMYLSIFLVGSLLVIAYLVFQEDLFPTPRPSEAATGRQLRELLDSNDALKAEVEAALARNRSHFDEGLKEFSSRLGKQESTLTVVMSRLEKLKSLNTRPEGGATSADVLMLKNRIEALHGDLKALKGDVSSLNAAVASFEAKVKEAAKTAPEPEPKPGTRPEITEVDRWISQLGDKEPSKRFEAVAELSRFKNPKVVEALIGRLKDPDFFIRRWVAEDLGEREAEAAVPPLVDLLEDDEESVRQAAVQALRKITKQKFGFKSGASSRERGRALAKWRNYVATVAKKK